MNRFIILAAAAATLTIGVASTSHAALVSYTGGVSSSGGSGGILVTAPLLVTDAAVFNQGIQGFDEQQGVVLATDLSVDGGVIAAGTVVNSHMLFLNADPVLGGRLSHGTAENSGNAVSFSFDGEILGVMSDSSGSLEANSNLILGATGSTYDSPFGARGLEANDFTLKNDDWYTVSGATIALGMLVTQPGDWIRVVTSVSQVPLPAAAWLFGSAILGLVGIAKRKRA